MCVPTLDHLTTFVHPLGCKTLKNVHLNAHFAALEGAKAFSLVIGRHMRGMLVQGAHNTANAPT